MALKDVVGTGVLVATVAAGMALAQNQVQIAGSGQKLPPVQQGTLADATGGGAGLSVSPKRAGFVDADRLTLNRLDDGSYVTGFLVFNGHCAAESIALVAQLFDRNDEPLATALTIERAPIPDGTTAVAPVPPRKLGERWSIQPGTYERIRLRVVPEPAIPAVNAGIAESVWAALRSAAIDYGYWTGHLPAKGLLILTRYTPATDPASKDACALAGSVPSTTTRALTLQPPLPSAVDTGVLFGSLVLALLTTLVAAIVIYRSTDLFLAARMGEVAFDFKSSWGANVAVGTGILAALTSGTVLSQEQYSSNSTTYLVMASLFAALVPLGSALYGLIRPPVDVGAPAPEAQGFVSVYLLSSAIVLWGAFGQLLILGMILRELALARVMSPDPAGLLIWMTKGLILLLMAYAVINALTTVKHASKKVPDEGSSTTRPAAAMV